MTTGRWPQALQAKAHLYRKGNYALQHSANANPDNFWDRRFYCWTSDPECGLDIAPKRPWLDLKDPSKGMHKLTRDASVDYKLLRNGFKGF